jgi:hypothetical protein
MVYLAQIGDMAEQFVDARIAGNALATLTGPSGQSVTLQEAMTNRCEQFARINCGLVTGEMEPDWAGGTARETEQKLRDQGFTNLVGQRDSYPRGALMFFNLEDTSEGHVVVVLGNGLVAEDAAEWRGTPNAPGIKRSTFDELLADHPGGPSGVYCILPGQGG